MDDEVPVLKLLANRTTRAMLRELEAGPSYPRALAAALGISEGDAQRRLHRLERAELVRGRWTHVGKTVKEYSLVAEGLDVRFTDGVRLALRRR